MYPLIVNNYFSHTDYRRIWAFPRPLRAPRIAPHFDEGLMSRRVDTLKKRFGERLRAARMVAGYETGRDFARDLGIEDFTYRKYERGQSVPPLDVLEDICRLTGREVGWLLFGTSSRTDSRSDKE